MKVTFIDLVWSVLSMITLAVSYFKGHLFYGLDIIYLMMSAVFVLQIVQTKKSVKNSIAVYGTVTGYSELKKRTGYSPILRYETEDGREITSVYSYVDKEMKYETGSEEMICYDPGNPSFFYFADRESDLTETYYRMIFIGGIIAVIFFIIEKFS